MTTRKSQRGPSAVTKRRPYTSATERDAGDDDDAAHDDDDLNAVLRLACRAPWPKDVFFLAWHSQPSRRLSATHRLVFCVAPRITHETHPQRVRQHRWTEVRAITVDTPCHPVYDAPPGSRHPAVSQSGLFARRDIPPRTLVVPYLGIVHNATPDDEDAASRYDAAIEVDDGTRLGVDATHAGCEARFVNDYRGILQRPNLFFEEWQAAFPREVVSASVGVTLPSHVRGLALFTGAHAVRAGSELCVSYGKGWWAANGERHVA